MGKQEDTQEIKRVHRQWWNANYGLDIPKMADCFAPQYLMFNLNGHPYYGLDEKIKLWEHYQKEIEVTDKPELWDIRITVDGDLGYLTCEGILPIRALTTEGTGAANLQASQEEVMA